MERLKHMYEFLTPENKYVTDITETNKPKGYDRDVIVEEDVKDLEQAEDNENYDYIVDLKAKSASLTQKGIEKKLNL